ncbi:MAG: plasmid pRiA4b ORF-3 family protein [Boseongicola sp. SB0673_bin_14]|nr:plasmid pRiA4b ORF-3 family protein [Boseongicola sp. SB0667_bin_21]MYI70137.1 plasmid pRiA4b ORF-3 family protein [Boseongicola sp. SB0673_bin_14]
MTNARTAPETGSVLLQLKVRLLGISPMIWRRVLVPYTMSLHELHGVLQVAMVWEAIHLFQFSVRGVVYAGPRLRRQPVNVPLSDFRSCTSAPFRLMATSVRVQED